MASYSETLAATQGSFVDSQAKSGVKRIQGLDSQGTSAGGTEYVWTQRQGHFGQANYSQHYQQVSYQPIVYSGARGPGR